MPYSESPAVHMVSTGTNVREGRMYALMEATRILMLLVLSATALSIPVLWATGLL